MRVAHTLIPSEGRSVRLCHLTLQPRDRGSPNDHSRCERHMIAQKGDEFCPGWGSHVIVILGLLTQWNVKPIFPDGLDRARVGLGFMVIRECSVPDRAIT